MLRNRTSLIALALVGGIASAHAADVTTNYTQGPGGFYSPSDRSGPYAIDSAGNAYLLAPGSAGSSQTVTGKVGLTNLVIGPNDQTIAGSVINTDVQGYAMGMFQLTGTFVGTVLFEGTVNGTTWTAFSATPIGTTGTEVTSATAPGMWIFPIGQKQIRFRVTSITSGTVTGALNLLTDGSAPVRSVVSSQGAAATTPWSTFEQGSTLSTAGVVPVTATASAGLLLSAAAANLYGLQVTNATATAGWVVEYNAATLPTAGATLTAALVLGCHPLAASGETAVTYSPGPPKRFGTGIAVLISSTSCAIASPVYTTGTVTAAISGMIR